MEKMSNIFPILKKLIVLASTIAFCHFSFAEDKKDTATGKSLFGTASFMTNYVDKGVTQTDGSWAMQTELGYQFGSVVRMAIWGSNVKYPTNSESLNLRGYINLHLDFTTGFSSELRYSNSRYFQSEDRNGNIVDLDFNIFDYKLLLQQDSNWEGSHTTSTWIAGEKDFSIPWNLIFTPRVGYTQVSASGASSYFDIKLELSYKISDLLLQSAVTYNSSASQFNGRGGTVIYFVAQTHF